MKTIRILLLAMPLVILLGCGSSSEPAKPDAADKGTVSEGAPCGHMSACSAAEGCESACGATACDGHRAMSQGELLDELDACCETAKTAGNHGPCSECPEACPGHDGQACPGTCTGHDGQICPENCPGHDGQACTGDCSGCEVENCAARQAEGCSQACARHKSQS